MTTTPSYPQPREGIAGTLRDDSDLLSLDARATAHRDALIAMARHLHSAVLVGNPAPKVEEMYQRIKAPRVGDYVVECTRWIIPDLDTRTKSFGVLLAHRQEWARTDAEWEADRAAEIAAAGWADDERTTEDAWYVQYGPDPADVCRWTNSDFIAVPIERDAFK